MINTVEPYKIQKFTHNHNNNVTKLKFGKKPLPKAKRLYITAKVFGESHSLSRWITKYFSSTVEDNISS